MRAGFRGPRAATVGRDRREGREGLDGSGALLAFSYAEISIDVGGAETAKLRRNPISNKKKKKGEAISGRGLDQRDSARRTRHGRREGRS